MFDDIERGTIALQFALAGAEGFYLLAVLVIDIVPGLGGLDKADGLVVVLCAETSDGQ